MSRRTSRKRRRPQKKRSSARASKSRGERNSLTLSDEWRTWVVDNLLAERSPETIVRGLVDSDVPESLARAEVAAILQSPTLCACRQLNDRIRQLELLSRLQRTLDSASPYLASVERRPQVAADEFFARYFAGNRPVVLTDVVTHWPAYQTWCPAYFRDRFGHLDIEIVSGRASDSDYDRNFDAHREQTDMATFVDRVVAAGDSNDLYLIARNNLMMREAFSALTGDIVIDESIFDPALLDNGTSLWFGPAGTITPLHHDTTNILFCQIHGRKRISLISPWHTELLRAADGFYSTYDLESHETRRMFEDAGIATLDVTLEPGEALFIPVGWWHHVKALDISITFSLLNFRRPNSYDWYRPGAPPGTRTPGTRTPGTLTPGTLAPGTLAPGTPRSARED